METNDYEMLKEELEQANQTVSELRRGIDFLSDEVEVMNRQIARYENAEDVLKILLECERRAEELERITGSDLAYDLWHDLRTATALAEAWIQQELHVSIYQTSNGIKIKHTIRIS